MPTKIKVKAIMFLRDSGTSQRSIASSRQTSRNSIQDVFRIADDQAISWNQIKDLEENEVYELFYPTKFKKSSVQKEPNYDYVHKELKKVGVTLKLLWQEYISTCTDEDVIPFGYSRYCEGYNGFIATTKATSHLIHKPGIICEVDWSGKKMKVVNQYTGEVSPIYLFVGNLPYSQYSYVEGCFDMKEDAWLNCHIHMFEYFEGASIRLICDNLKTGVIKHPKNGEIILNEGYEALASYYNTAIMPAPVRVPKAKPSVEGTVGKIATAIIAKLRNNEYHTLQEANLDIRKALKEFNEGLFQKRDGSRYLIFIEEEKDTLIKLPIHPYEIAKWKYNYKVSLNYHVSIDHNYYSVPAQYIGKSVNLKITDTLLEVYCDYERIASHHRFPATARNQYSTCKEHMPMNHQKYSQWDDIRIINWATEIGPQTKNVIEMIFESVKIKEQGYNACLAVLRLSKTYSSERLEVACELALTKFSVPRYKHLNGILKYNQDKLYIENSKVAKKPSKDTSTIFLRGSNYYGGDSNDKQ